MASFNTRTHGLLVMAGLMVFGSSNALAQGQQKVELKNYAGRVEVIPENRTDVAISVVQGNNKLPAPKVSVSGDKLVLDGGLTNRNSYFNMNWDSQGQSKGSMKIAGYPMMNYKDLPTITVRTPMHVKLSTSGLGTGHIARSDSLTFSNAGSSDWTIDPVTDKVKASIAGSGDLHLATAGQVELSAAASGDITVGDIQSLKSSQSASGDLTVGRVFGPAEISIAGSGDTRLKSVKGDVEIAIAGTGDVRIADGTAPRFEVSIAGSGDVRFEGTAGDVDISIAGSGDVTIKAATGKVSKNVIGSGDVRVGQ